ncbi:MAG: hypothetical protein WCI66_11510 [Gammaproteobacteria bacterium]|jgi:hypothetical protein
MNGKIIEHCAVMDKGVHPVHDGVAANPWIALAVARSSNQLSSKVQGISAQWNNPKS